MESETQNQSPILFEQYPHKEVLSQAIQNDRERQQTQRAINDSPVSNVIPLHSRPRKTEITQSGSGHQDQDPGPQAS